MQEWQLIDECFSHEKYTVPQKLSQNVIWKREDLDPNKPTFFSHFALYNPSDFTNKYGLIFESQAILPQIYGLIDNVIGQYKLVFTHSSELLRRYSNTRWIPGGGIWVGGSINEQLLGGSGGEIKIHDKSKLCSIVSSNKNLCPLHELRILSVQMIRALEIPNVDVYGTATGKWVPIIDSLQDYMFSVVIENIIDEGYFTEKLLNCLATGTVPIYWGASRLDKFFNVDGIIRINSVDELLDILQKLTPEDYYKRMSAIQENFKLCQQYSLIEDYIFNNYNNDIT